MSMAHKVQYDMGKWLHQNTPIATGAVRYGIPNLPATSKTATIKRELVNMCRAFGAEGDDWQLLENPLGFPDAKTKANWTTTGDRWDVKDLLTIGHLETSKFYPGTTYKIAMFITRQRPWVGQSYREWSTEDWHCWVGIIRKLPDESGMTGKELIIWDSNFDEHGRWGKLPRAMGAQNVLVEKMRRKSVIERVWIGGGGNSEEGLCLQLSFNFIHGILCGRGVGNLPRWDEMREYNWTEVDFMRITRNSASWASTRWLLDCYAKGLSEERIKEVLVKNKASGLEVTMETPCEGKGEGRKHGSNEDPGDGRSIKKQKRGERWATPHLSRVQTRSNSTGYREGVSSTAEAHFSPNDLNVQL